MPKIHRFIQPSVNLEPEAKSLFASFEDSPTRSSIDEFHISQIKPAKFLIRTARSCQPTLKIGKKNIVFGLKKE